MGGRAISIPYSDPLTHLECKRNVNLTDVNLTECKSNKSIWIGRNTKDRIR